MYLKFIWIFRSFHSLKMTESLSYWAFGEVSINLKCVLNSVDFSPFCKRLKMTMPCRLCKWIFRSFHSLKMTRICLSYWAFGEVSINLKCVLNFFGFFVFCKRLKMTKVVWIFFAVATPCNPLGRYRSKWQDFLKIQIKFKKFKKNLNSKGLFKKSRLSYKVCGVFARFCFVIKSH